MKRFLILFLLCFSMSGTGSAVCFLTVDNQGSLDTSVITQISLVEITNYYETVEEIPPSGLSEKDCTYNLSILEMSDRLLVTLKGPSASTYADSRLKGMEGFQQAFLRAILKRKSRKKRSDMQKISTPAKR